MSNPSDADATPITSARQLAEHIARGCKPPSAFAIGTEHEKFGFRHDDWTPPPYEPGGIRAVLEGLSGDGWEPILDSGRPIGLKRGPASVSLEPAGQLELSGATLPDLHATAAEMDAHFAAVRAVAEPLGLGFAPLGFHPTMRRDQMPWMPKGRYAIMRRYMPLVGTLGLDMMTRTCTVQVNLDYESEADMARKLRVSLALQPVATALFANSPFTEGRPNGFLSYRSQVWTDTDNGRSGMPLAFFEDGFGFERYVQWLLDVPMYFIARDGAFIDVAGRSFRDFLAGRLDVVGPGGAPVGPATLGDFDDHMTTAFTEVRVKRFLEMRGADAGPPAMMVAQSALWVGLLYDPAALAAAEALVRRHPWTDYVAVRAEVPRLGLRAPWQGGCLRDLARDMVGIAADGLRSRARRGPDGRDETKWLETLLEIVDGGPTPAERLLEKFQFGWDGEITRIFRHTAV
jgi:glutamate--cysteine ligase